MGEALTCLPIQPQKGDVGLREKATLQTFMIDPHHGSGGEGVVCEARSETPTHSLEDRGAGPSTVCTPMCTYTHTRVCTRTHTHTHMHTRLFHSVLSTPSSPHCRVPVMGSCLSFLGTGKHREGLSCRGGSGSLTCSHESRILSHKIKTGVQ